MQELKQMLEEYRNGERDLPSYAELVALVVKHEAAQVREAVAA